MMIAADLAEFYQQEREKGRQFQLKQWIDASPDNLAVALLATGIATLEDVVTAPARFGETVAIDLLKLGTGAASGTKIGIAEDILRLLSIIPEGSIVRGVGGLRPLLGSFVETHRTAKYFKSILGGVCAPISIAQALIKTGYRYVIKLEDVAAAMKKTVAQAGEGAGHELVAATLRELKANFTEIPKRTLGTWAEIHERARSFEGVLLVNIYKIVDNVPVGHQIIIAKSRNAVKIFDRYGVFDTLEALSAHYGTSPFRLNPEKPIFAIANWVVDPTLVANLNRVGPLGAVVVRAALILGFHPRKSASQLRAEYEAYIRDHDAGPLPANPSPGGPPPSNADYLPFEEVPMTGGFMLSALSMRRYQTYHMWPLIWDENREVIGDNPNKVPPGVKLMLRKREKYTGPQIEDARRRSLNWKSYG
jgi:hypothetical protein